jgi:hypothetical protein
MLRFFREFMQTQIAEQIGLSQMHVSRVVRRTPSYLQDGMSGATLISRLTGGLASGRLTSMLNHKVGIRSRIS